MQEEQEHKNQAANLAQLVSEINQQLDASDVQNEQNHDNYVEVDVLNLPPRREVHKKSKHRLSLNLRQPIFRFIFVVFLIIIIGLLLFYLTDEQWSTLFN